MNIFQFAMNWNISKCLQMLYCFTKYTKRINNYPFLIHHSFSASLKTTCDANTSLYVRCTFFMSVCWLNWLNSGNLGLEFLHHQKTLEFLHHGLNLLHHSNSIESHWDWRGGTFGIEGEFAGSDSGHSSMAATQN